MNNIDTIRKRVELTKTRLVLDLPLFAPLIAQLKIEENNNIETLACSYKDKLIVYNKDFVSSISNNTLKAVLLHEILHYLFIHDLSILKDSKDRIIMNIVTDALINYLVVKILKDSRFLEETNAITFNFLREYVEEFKNLSDEELSKEDTLYLFRKLKEALKDFYNDLQQVVNIMNNISNTSSICSSSSSSSNKSSSSSDSSDNTTTNNNTSSSNTSNISENKESKSSSTSSSTSKDTNNISEEVKKKINEIVEKHFSSESKSTREALKKSIEDALRINREIEKNEKEIEKIKEEVRKTLEVGKIALKTRGLEPLGVEKLLDMILKRKRKNWRKILRETFSEIESLAVDYDFTRKSKKADVLESVLNVRTYIPALEKEEEEANIVIGIDTSGSISDQDYREFVNEIYNLMSEIKNVKGYIVLWDAEVQKVIKVRNGWNKEVFDSLKNRKGYGGTTIESFFKEAEKLVKNRKKNTFIIVFTDGYTEEVKKSWIKDYRKVVFVLSKDHSIESLRKIRKEKNVKITFVD